MRHLDGKPKSYLLFMLAALAVAGCSPKDQSRARAINGEQSSFL